MDTFCVTTAVCELCSPAAWAAAAGNLDPVRNDVQPRCHHCGELGQVPPPEGWGVLWAAMTSLQSSSYRRNEKLSVALEV